MNDWIHTRRGVTLVEGTLPSIARGLKSLTAELKRFNDAKEAQIPPTQLTYEEGCLCPTCVLRRESEAIANAPAHKVGLVYICDNCPWTGSDPDPPQFAGDRSSCPRCEATITDITEEDTPMIKLFTTSDIFTSWPTRERRNPANVRATGVHGDGSPFTFYSTGKLEAAIEAGFMPLVVSSRTQVFDSDNWWVDLIELAEGRIYLMDNFRSGNSPGQEFRDLCADVLSDFGIDWPMEVIGEHEEPMNWQGGLATVNKQQVPDVGPQGGEE
jgi:hypothetical protein